MNVHKILSQEMALTHLAEKKYGFKNWVKVGRHAKSLILTQIQSRKSEINVTNTQIEMTLCGSSAQI